MKKLRIALVIALGAIMTLGAAASAHADTSWGALGI